MTATEQDLVIERNADFSQVVNYVDSTGAAVDLTSYTASMTIRPEWDSSVSVLALTTTNGRIVLGDSAGTVTMSISASDTDDFPSYWRGVYDLNITSAAGVVTRLMRGAVTTNPRATS